MIQSHDQSEPDTGPPLTNLCSVQVQRVEQRVSLKKTVAVRLEQDLVQAQLAAGRGPKRTTEPGHTVVRTCC